MKKKAGLVYLIVFLFAAKISRAADTTIIVRSPKEAVTFKLQIKNKALFFSISYGNYSVVENSPIIFSLNDSDITHNVRLGKLSRYSTNESYPWLGAHSTAHDKSIGVTIP